MKKNPAKSKTERSFFEEMKIVQEALVIVQKYVDMKTYTPEEKLVLLQIKKSK